MKRSDDEPIVPDFLDNKYHIEYSHDEHKNWAGLYAKQITFLQKYACKPYLDGLSKLELPDHGVPKLAEVSARLHSISGWSIEPVDNLIGFYDFFELLSKKHFPAATFLRNSNAIEFSEDPDIFHEIFGHCPLLTNPDFASFLYEVGKFARYLDKSYHAMLARLFWFTIEVGLIKEKNEIRIYGAAIISSEDECNFALDHDVKNRSEFNLIQLLRTPYNYDKIQRTYFVLDGFETLYNLLNHDLLAVFKEAHKLGMLPLT